MRDKDSNDYLGLTNRDGTAYLADTAGYSGYFLSGNGTATTLGGTLSVPSTITSTVGNNVNILSWNNAGGIQRESTQGGITIYSDSFSIRHAGDGGPSVKTTLGLTDSSTTETAYLTADGNVNIVTDLQDAGTKTWEFQNDADFVTPSDGDILMGFGGTISGTGDISGNGYTRAAVFGINTVSQGSGTLRVGIDTSQQSHTGLTIAGNATSQIVFLQAFYEGTTARGSIQVNASNVTVYNTTSDYRIKDNVVEMDNVLSLNGIRSLRPVEYNFTDNLTGDKVEGFIAHEVQSLIPQAVTGEKDAVNPDGTIKLQQLDMTQMIPLIVSAIQEVDLQVQDNTTRIENLEAAVFDSNFNDLTVTDTITTNNLVVTNAATINKLTVTGTTTIADLKVDRIISQGNTPTAVLGATTTGQGSTHTISGNDIAGSITITTGTDTPTNPIDSGEQITVTFNTPYDEAPRITLTPTDENSAQINYYVTKTTDSFIIHFTDVPAESTEFSFDYQIIQ